MINFIDTSNWQGHYNVASLQGVDAIVCKATEGIGFVDKYCDGIVQQCISLGKPWGFYHYARNNDAQAEARFFMDNCKNYFKHGIPVLDWEENQSVTWVNEFVRTVHNETGVWPWIYANPWRFNQMGVEENCDRWVASYPAVDHPTFEQARGWTCPDADGAICAWQFCSDGLVSGYSGNLDCNLFYGTAEQWGYYANPESRYVGDAGSDGCSTGPGDATVVENDEFKVTIERK